MGLRFVFAFGLVGFGLGLVCVCVFALGLVGFGVGLVCVCFGFRAEPIMGPRFVFAFDLVWVWCVFAVGPKLNL